MDLWIPITILAAFSQNLRFMLQKNLNDTGLSPRGATLSRFLYSAPLVALFLSLYLWGTKQSLPAPDIRFFIFVVTGGVSQILATIFIVQLFSLRNFAVGITFGKTEVIFTAFIGMVILGDHLSRMGWFSLAIGFLGVIILTDPPLRDSQKFSRIFNKPAAIGIGSGLLFAFSAVGYRGAALSLDVEDVLLCAGFTLFMATLIQSTLLLAWMYVKDRAEIRNVFGAYRVGALVGLSSMIGSFCWFTAFAMQTAALVKALGQIELLFSFCATVFVFRQTVTRREYIGTGLLCISILMLVLFLK